MQIAHIAVVRDTDFGQFLHAGSIFVLRGLGAATGFTNHVSHQSSKQSMGRQRVAPGLQFFIE